MGNRNLALVGPFAPFRGGIAQFNDRLARELQVRGHTITTVSFSRLYPQLLFPGTTQYDPSRVGTALPWIDTLNPVSWSRAGRAIRASRPAATVCAYWTPHLAPALTATLKSFAGPSIGLIHNASPHGGGGALSAWLTRRFLGCLKGVVTLSEGVSQEVRNLGFPGPLITSAHPPYDQFGPRVARSQAREVLGLPDSGPVLLCFGLVRAYKGFDVAVHAFRALFPDRSDARLVIAGEAYDPEMDDLLTTLNDSRIIRHGRYIPDDQVAQYYSAADLLLLPYRTATQSGPLSAAAFYGLPVVATDVGGLGDSVRLYGMGVVSSGASAQAIAEAIGRALQPDILASSSSGALRMAAETGWDKLANDLETLVDRIN